MNAPTYNFAYLDEQTKRMIRRAILKAIAIPGYQVPFASREMPMPYGWGTGGVQVTATVATDARIRLTQHAPVTRVVLVTATDLDRFATSGREAGADAVLYKDAEPEVLLRAIRDAGALRRVPPA